MIQYALARKDMRDNDYGYILSTHHSLRSARKAQRRHQDSVILFYGPHRGGKGSTVSLVERFMVPTEGDTP
jgi:hypothetical protein